MGDSKIKVFDTYGSGDNSLTIKVGSGGKSIFMQMRNNDKRQELNKLQGMTILTWL